MPLALCVAVINSDVKDWSSVHLSIDSSSCLFGSTLLFSVIGNTFGNFLNQRELKPTPLVTCSGLFSRRWRRLYVFESCFDWLLCWQSRW